MLRSCWAGLGILGLLVSCTSTQEAPQVPVTDDPEPTTPAVTPAQPAPAEPASTEDAPSASNAASEPPSAESGASSAAPAPAESAKPPGLTVTETRTLDVMRQLIIKNRQRFRDCFEIERRKEPGIKGTLTLHFKLDPAGKVKFAEVNLARSTLKGTELASCALQALRALPFPRSSRGFESEVNYPFDFR
jgi:hypothetical protein